MPKPRLRLSYANVVSTLCLFILLGGGAYAAQRYVISSTDQIKPSVLAQLSSSKAATAAKKKRGPPGPAGPAGAAGAAGPPGAAGANGIDGSARAYGRVISDNTTSCTGGCTFDHAKGITSVTHPSSGLYCITAPGLSPAETTAVVSVDYDTTGFPATAAATPSDSFCGLAFGVVTYSSGALAQNVGFRFVIP